MNRGQILVICSPYISSDFRGKEARARRRVFRCVSRDPPGGVGIAPFVPGHFRLGSLEVVVVLLFRDIVAKGGLRVPQRVR